MSDTSKEMMKQLGLYADTVTAFATAQLLGFVYLMAQGGCFTKNVLTVVWLPIGISFLVNAGYMGLVSLCHRAEDLISANGLDAVEKTEDGIQDVMKGIRTARRAIILVDWVATIAVLLLIKCGAHEGRFYFDCKS